MMVREHIITKLMAKQIMKIDHDLTQRDNDNLKNELAKCATKIKITEYIVKQCQKYGF